MNRPAPHPNLLAQFSADTPYGRVLLARSASGLAGLWNAGQAHHPPALAVPEADHPWFSAARRALDAWADAPHDPDLPPLDPHGTPFQLAVWTQLRAIPRGASTSYGAIAQALGKPQASRAVGAAVGRNPLGILVPCHRVLGANGALTGYASGLALKIQLLQQEGVLI